RHFQGRRGIGANHASHGPSDDSQGPLAQSPARADDPDDLDMWCAFHQRVEELPLEEREVVGLIFYHGWTQAEVADVLHVHVRTVRRRWEAALVKLHRTLKPQAPDV